MAYIRTGRRRQIDPKYRSRPELSPLDKTIYIVMIMLAFALMFGIFILFGIKIPMSIAFRDPTAIAVDNDAAIFCSAPLGMLWAFSLTILGSLGRQYRQPIFGRYVKIGSATVKVDPIFSPDFWSDLSVKTKTKIKNTAIFLLVALLVCLALLPCGFYSRQVLHEDQRVSNYNIFNTQTHTANVSDAEAITIDILVNKGDYRIEQTITFSDATYRFTVTNFYRSDHETALRYMIAVKNAVPTEKLTLLHAERIENVITDLSLTFNQGLLVYELYYIES